MYIPTYFDVVSVFIYNTIGTLVDTISICNSSALGLHTLESIEQYVEVTYDTTCSLLAMQFRTNKECVDSEPIIVADFSIEID